MIRLRIYVSLSVIVKFCEEFLPIKGFGDDNSVLLRKLFDMTKKIMSVIASENNNVINRYTPLFVIKDITVELFSAVMFFISNVPAKA